MKGGRADADPATGGRGPSTRGLPERGSPGGGAGLPPRGLLARLRPRAGPGGPPRRRPLGLDAVRDRGHLSQARTGGRDLRGGRPAAARHATADPRRARPVTDRGPSSFHLRRISLFDDNKGGILSLLWIILIVILILALLGFFGRGRW